MNEAPPRSIDNPEIIDPLSNDEIVNHEARKYTYSNMMVATRIENDVDGPAVRFMSVTGHEYDRTTLPFDTLVSQLIALMDQRVEALPLQSTIGSKTLHFAITSMEDIKDIVEDILASDIQAKWEGKSAVFQHTSTTYDQAFSRDTKKFNRRETIKKIFTSQTGETKAVAPTIKDYIHQALEGKDRAFLRQFTMQLFWDSMGSGLAEEYLKVAQAGPLELQRFQIDLTGKTFAFEEDNGVVSVETGQTFKNVKRINITSGGSYNVRRRSFFYAGSGTYNPHSSNFLTTVWRNESSQNIELAQLRQSFKGIAKKHNEGVICKQAGENLVIDREGNAENSLILVETPSSYKVDVHFTDPEVANLELSELDGKVTFDVVKGDLHAQTVGGYIMGNTVVGNVSAVGVARMRVEKEVAGNVTLVSSHAQIYRIKGRLLAIKSGGRYRYCEGGVKLTDSTNPHRVFSDYDFRA